MRLCTFREYDHEAAGVVVDTGKEGERVVSLEDLNDAWGQDFGPGLSGLIRRNQVWQLRDMLKKPGKLPTTGWKIQNLKYAAPYRDPPKIWGVGLNFEEHAAAMAAPIPDEPGGFMRPSTSITNPGGPIAVPRGIGRVTAEAEIGVVMGARVKDAKPDEAREGILGYAAVLDVTAEELLQKNPRYLARAKSYDSFFAFGPFIVTRDEWETMPTTRVRTTLNGKLVKENLVGNMRMSPVDLVAYHSRVFAWEPGDILLTGTPGATPIQPGDRVGAEVSALATLECSVT